MSDENGEVKKDVCRNADRKEIGMKGLRLAKRSGGMMIDDDRTNGAMSPLG